MSMATNFLETAKNLKEEMQALLHKLDGTKGTIGTLLDAARRTEGSMIDREEKEKQEREERERAERLKAVLESDADLAAHAGGPEEPEPEQQTPADTQPAPVEVAPKEPKKEPARTEEQRPQRPQNGREPQRERQQGGDRRQGDRRQESGDRKSGDARGPRRDNTGSQRAVVINMPNPSDNTGKAARTDKKKPFETTDKKAKSKKTMMKEQGPTARGWEDDSQMGNRRKVKKHEQEAQQPKPVPVVIDHAVITTETITVKDLSEKLGKPANEILKKLLMLGIIANINQELDFDTCELIASEFNITLEQQLAKSFEDVLMDTADDVDAPETLKPRPPVVTIMGHVDHGKTSLLDAIRNSHVTAGEAGGITQHIGAYTVTLNGKQITFIDTPGHEAFTAMRARGAQVTDIVILVVAADDGIMPQTIEAINHAKAAGVPIIVAINKIDRDTADPERVKQQLTEYGLVTEEWGGDTICVPVSAKKQINLDQLLEMVLLQADVLELKANPDRLAKGTIIEAQLDKTRGPVATVLVQNGTLKKGDMIVAGMAFGKVRAMMDDKGRTVNSAGPSTPVEVLGFNEVPAAGDLLFAANDDKLSRQVADERRQKAKAAQVKQAQKVSLDDLFSQMAEGELKELNLIVKADVQGSVEAVKQALEKLSNDEVRVRVIHSGVGAITGSDIMFASASNAIVIGFNVRPDSTARAAAEKEKVDVRTYRVIYNAIEDVENAMKGMFKPVFREVELGRCTVRSTFRISGVGTIAGAYVNEGKVTRTAQVRVVRGGIVLHDGRIGSLKRFKDDAREVMAGYECGISIENFNDILEDDVIECYEMEEVKR
ncbi:MAG: translation initiation factor IF-2 [Clostridia bacterium]|nr:translation initiation factor IF-2 [Clostridia bacterium]